MVGKGLKVNAGKSMIMTGGNNMGKVTESGAYPLEYVGKESRPTPFCAQLVASGFTEDAVVLVGV